MLHGLPAREYTAKMAVPPRKQLRLNTYPLLRGQVYPCGSRGRQKLHRNDPALNYPR